MQPENLTQLLRQHPFISDMDETLLKTLLSCASNTFFSDDEYLFREGEEATKFYLIRTGRIALELHGSERGMIRDTDNRTGRGSGLVVADSPLPVAL